jgi:hypothetical protein
VAISYALPGRLQGQIPAAAACPSHEASLLPLGCAREVLADAPSGAAPRLSAHRLPVRIQFRSQCGCEVPLVTPRNSSKPQARLKSADQVLRRDSYNLELQFYPTAKPTGEP